MKPGSYQRNNDVKFIQQLNKNTSLANNGSRIAQNTYQNPPSKSVEQQRIRIISQQPAPEDPYQYYNLPKPQSNQSHKQQSSSISNDLSFYEEGQINSYNDSQRTASGMHLRCPLCPLNIQCYELKLNSISYHSYCIQKIIDEQIQQNKYPIRDPKDVIIQDDFIQQNFPPFHTQILQYRTKQQNANIKANYMHKVIDNQLQQKLQYGEVNQRSNEKRIVETDRTSNCIICNNKSSHEVVRKLPCSHHVHASCVSQNKYLILQKKLQCSICKNTIKIVTLRLFNIPIPDDYFIEQIKQIQKRYAHIFQKCQNQSCNEFWYKKSYDQKFCYNCQIILGSRIQMQEKPRSISEQQPKSSLIESKPQLYSTQNYLLYDSRAFKTIRNKCLHCDQETGFQYITLSCQHYYHPECLNIVINSQVLDKSNTFLKCICKGKIYMSTLRSVIKNDIALTQLVDNQYKMLQSKYNYFQKCPSSTCSYFFIKGKSRSFYCPQCIQFYN